MLTLATESLQPHLIQSSLHANIAFNPVVSLYVIKLDVQRLIIIACCRHRWLGHRRHPWDCCWAVPGILPVSQMSLPAAQSCRSNKHKYVKPAWPAAYKLMFQGMSGLCQLHLCALANSWYLLKSQRDAQGVFVLILEHCWLLAVQCEQLKGCRQVAHVSFGQL